MKILYTYFILIYISVLSNAYAQVYTGAAYWGKTTANYVYPSQQGYPVPSDLTYTDGTAADILAEYMNLTPIGNTIIQYSSSTYFVPVCRLALDSDGSCSSYVDYQWAIQRTIDCPPLTTPSPDYFSCVETVPNNPSVTPEAKMHGEDCKSIIRVGNN